MRPDIDGAGARLARGDRLSVPQAAALLAYIEELEATRECAYAEYARNLISVWDAPRQQTAAGQSTHFMFLDSAVDLLRQVLAHPETAHLPLGSGGFEPH